MGARLIHAGLACLLLCVVAPVSSARRLLDDDFHFQQCNTQPVFNVSDVVISPNPAIHGQDILVSLTGNNTREVTGATLSVTIYYRGWPVQRQSRDICHSDRPVTPACPFSPGNLTITSSDSVPLIAPVGPYSMRMQAWDLDGAAVMCIDIWFRVVSAPSSSAAAPSRPAAAAAAAGGWRALLPSFLEETTPFLGERVSEVAAAAAAGSGGWAEGGDSSSGGGVGADEQEEVEGGEEVDVVVAVLSGLQAAAQQLRWWVGEALPRLAGWRGDAAAAAAPRHPQRAQV